MKERCPLNKIQLTVTVGNSADLTLQQTVQTVFSAFENFQQSHNWVESTKAALKGYCFTSGINQIHMVQGDTAEYHKMFIHSCLQYWLTHPCTLGSYKYLILHAHRYLTNFLQNFYHQKYLCRVHSNIYGILLREYSYSGMVSTMNRWQRCWQKGITVECVLNGMAMACFPHLHKFLTTPAEKNPHWPVSSLTYLE